MILYHVFFWNDDPILRWKLGLFSTIYACLLAAGSWIQDCSMHEGHEPSSRNLMSIASGRFFLKSL